MLYYIGMESKKSFSKFFLFLCVSCLCLSGIGFSYIQAEEASEVPENSEVTFEEKSEEEIGNQTMKLKNAPMLQSGDAQPAFHPYGYLIQDNGDGVYGEGDKEYYSTPTSPAMIDYVEMVSGGGYWYRLVINYENLEPNSQYYLDVHTDVRLASPTANLYGLQRTSSDTGNGRWVVFVDYGVYANMRYTSFYDTTFEVRDNNGNRYEITQGDQPYDLIYNINRAAGTITVNGRFIGGAHEPAYVPSEQATDGVDIQYAFAANGGYWAGDYTLEFQLVKIHGDETFEPIGEPIIHTLTETHDTTYGESRVRYFDLGHFDNLEREQRYAIFVKMYRSDEPDKYLENNSVYNTYIQFEVFDKEEIVETPSRAVVEIKNFDQDTDTLLSGVTFTVYDSENQEVASWVSDGTPYELELYIGSYTIKQTNVPEGYKVAEPLHLEITDENANISGSVFQATGTATELMRVLNGRDAYRHVLKIGKRGEPQDEYVYCLNANKATPAEMDALGDTDLLYREHLATEKLLYAQTTNKTEDATGVQKDIMRVLVNGFPNNAIGLREQYNLTDEFFIDATQKAIWHFSDNVRYNETDFSHEEGAYDAYLALINATNELPENVMMHMYIPSSKNYQDLLSLRFYRDEELFLQTRNYKIPTTDITIQKIWDDEDDKDKIRPESITVELYANEEVYETITLTGQDRWICSFTGLPLEDDDGNKIEYTIQEEAVKGYQTTIDGYTITNQHKPEEPVITPTPTPSPTPTATPTPTPSIPDKPNTPQPKKVEVPDTKDDTNLWVWSLHMILSISMIGILLYKKKRALE